jgi:hypothetical protein
MNAPQVLSILLAVIALYTLGSLLENEFIRAYLKKKELESNNGGTGMVVQEALHTVKAIELLTDAALSDVLESSLTPVSARLEQTKYLCSALNYALFGQGLHRFLFVCLFVCLLLSDFCFLFVWLFVCLFVYYNIMY